MKIEVLFNDIADLYGDHFNIDYLCKSIKQVEVIETGINEVPYFVNHKVDLIYMGPLKERFQKVVVDRLRPYKDRIKQLIEDNVFFFLTGNAFEVFGQRINDDEALKIFDYYSVSDMNKHESCCYLASYQDIDIVGFMSRYSRTYNNDSPLFNIVKCNGLNETSDGYHYKNFLATYSIGPILIYNPLFTEKLLEMLDCDYVLPYKDIAYKAYKSRLDIFKQKDIGINNLH